MNQLTEAAREYVALGLRVIALSGKMPNTKLHPHGLKDFLDASTDAAALAAHFGHPATTGVGILTTFPLIVVDIDSEEGAQNWRDIAGDEYLPDSWVAKTGRGMHLYMGTMVQTGTMKLATGLDLKGDGGYVAAPPSRHPSGVRYEWLMPPDGSLNEAPEVVTKTIERAKRERERTANGRRDMRQRRKKSYEDGKFYPVATFDAIIERVKTEAEGNRNALTYWAARTMIEEGADMEDLEALGEAATEAGLDPREVRQGIRSALNAKG